LLRSGLVARSAVAAVPRFDVVGPGSLCPCPGRSWAAGAASRRRSSRPGKRVSTARRIIMPRSSTSCQSPGSSSVRGSLVIAHIGSDQHG
jgi:hypothetical protein